MEILSDLNTTQWGKRTAKIVTPANSNNPTNYTLYTKDAQGNTLTTYKLYFFPKQFQLFHRYLSEIRRNLTSSKEDYLFYSGRKQRLTVDTINRMIRPLKGLFLDKNLNAKTIRQSVIANWLNVDKRDIGEVQKMSGHCFPTSTEAYRSEEREELEMILKFHPLQG